MILFLYGSDTYRRMKKMREHYDAQRKKYPHADVLHVDIEERPESWENVRDFIAQPSIFAEKKIVVVKESGVLGKEFAKEERLWIRMLKDARESNNVFIIISDTDAPKKSFQFLTEAPVRFLEFEELKGKKLETFILQELKKRNVSCTRNTLQHICCAVSTQKDRAWRIINWCDQLSCAGFKNPIQEKDAKQFVRSDESEEVFTRAKEINLTRDFITRLVVLETTLLQNADARHLFNSLAILARGNDALCLADYDIAVKSGGVEYEEALMEYVLESRK